MPVNKMIKFYYLSPNPCITANGVDLEKATYAIFKSAFPDMDYYDINLKDRKLFFDIMEYDSEKMFGTCSTDETIKATNFMQKRNKSTLKTAPFTTVGGEEQLEAYTFFYIDFVHNRMAAIFNKKISKIHEALMEFIYQKSGNMSSICILPEAVKDLRKEAKKIVDPSWLKLAYGVEYGLDFIPNVKKSLKDDIALEKYNLEIKLTKTSNHFIDRLIEMKNDAKNENLSSIKLVGKNELGVEETFNFFEAIYSNTVPLQLTDDNDINIDYIKNKLHENLVMHLSKRT